jgi:precorrin-3B synthase
MRDAVRGDGLHAFKSAIADLSLTRRLARRVRRRSRSALVLRSGRVALGVGLPFGHSDAEALQRLVAAARRFGASGLRTAPGRALLTLGLAPNAAQGFAAEAASLGFIVEADDPRRRVIACAGAPICASGEIPARAMAPAIARALSAMPRAADLVHVSGCAKGCAHPASAPVAIVGRAGACDLFLDGALSCSVTVAAAPERIGQIMRARVEVAHG